MPPPRRSGGRCATTSAAPYGSDQANHYQSPQEPLRRLLHAHLYLFHYSCWTSGPYCYLQDLFTAPEARGQGVGRALIEAVAAAAREAGASRLYWLTHKTNTQAMALYDQVAARSGFVQYRRILG